MLNSTNKESDTDNLETQHRKGTRNDLSDLDNVYVGIPSDDQNLISFEAGLDTSACQIPGHSFDTFSWECAKTQTDPFSSCVIVKYDR